nr:cell division protein ZipA-like [Aegilops tauschii subsp. strangulata]
MPSGCAGADRPTQVMRFSGPPRGTLPRPPVPAPEEVQLPHPAAPVQEPAPLEPIEEDVATSPQHASPPPLPIVAEEARADGDSSDPSAAAAAAAADPVPQQEDAVLTRETELVNEILNADNAFSGKSLSPDDSSGSYINNAAHDPHLYWYGAVEGSAPDYTPQLLLVLVKIH